MAKFVVTRDGKVVNQYFIDQAVTTIGREGGCNLRLDDPQVSREHARVLRVGEDDVLEDLQSGNGTSVNGRRIARQLLRHQDVVDIGGFQLRYMSARATADADLERTMIIRARPPVLASGNVAADVPTARTGRPPFAGGSVILLATPDGENAGTTQALDRVVTTFGVAEHELIVLTRRPMGVFLSLVSGERRPRVNRKEIGDGAQRLRDGDEIESAGYRLRFSSTG